jgi:hypothetical protein
VFAANGTVDFLLVVLRRIKVRVDACGGQLVLLRDEERAGGVFEVEEGEIGGCKELGLMERGEVALAFACFAGRVEFVARLMDGHVHLKLDIDADNCGFDEILDG